jgi:hypothetical protein
MRAASTSVRSGARSIRRCCDPSVCGYPLDFRPPRPPRHDADRDVSPSSTVSSEDGSLVSREPHLRREVAQKDFLWADFPRHRAARFASTTGIHAGRCPECSCGAGLVVVCCIHRQPVPKCEPPSPQSGNATPCPGRSLRCLLRISSASVLARRWSPRMAIPSPMTNCVVAPMRLQQASTLAGDFC